MTSEQMKRMLCMERAGASEENEDVERKGLGTPATRAEIIEKFVRSGFIDRKKKLLIPTDDGIRLITILPETVKSPKMPVDLVRELQKK